MTIRENNLKKLRLQTGLRQTDIAEMMGFKSEDRICQWERGSSMPNVQNLFRLCSIYHVTPFDIYQFQDLFPRKDSVTPVDSAKEVSQGV